MALVQKFSAEVISGCSKLLITDITGMYSSSNTTGWGTPNIDPSDVTEAYILVGSSSSGVIYSLNVTSVVQAITLPSSYVDNFTFPLIEIDPSDIGQTDLITDKIYNISYMIDGESVDGKVLTTCNTQCCVDKLFNKAADSYLCGGNCSTNAMIMEALKARALLLQASKWAFSCYKLEDAEKLLKQAMKICKTNNTNCGCGCS